MAVSARIKTQKNQPGKMHKYSSIGITSDRLEKSFECDAIIDFVYPDARIVFRVFDVGSLPSPDIDLRDTGNREYSYPPSSFSLAFCNPF